MPQSLIQIHSSAQQERSLFWFLQCFFTAGEFSRFIVRFFGSAADAAQTPTHPDSAFSCAMECLSDERKEHFQRSFQNFRLNQPVQNILTRWEIEALTQKKLPEHFPLALRYAGEPQVLRSLRVAIVGSRHPTFYGREQAAHFARTLAAQGICVVSGAAIGVDTVANVVAHAHGQSVAVLGSGLANPYPRSNSALFHSLTNSGRGLILSEFDDFQRAEKWNFPRRNRIIAALCDFLLVIEAGLGSGTLITAHLAVDLGIDVGALPGPVHSPTSQGSNLLIKEGAFCIEKPEEILERFVFLRHQREASREAPCHDVSAL